MGTVTQRSTYPWFVVCVLSAAYFVSILDRYFMAVVMVPLKADLLLSDTQLGVLHGLGFALLYIVATPVFGRLADSSSRRNLIAFGILGWTVATIASGFASSFNSLLGARVGLGLAEAALLPAGMSLIIAYFATQQVGRATSVFIMGGNLGGLAALVGGGLLLDHFSKQGGLTLGAWHFAPWQALFVVGALPGLMVMALVFMIREPARTGRDAGQAIRGGFAAALREMRQRSSAYLFHIISASFAILLAGGLVAWSTTFYVRVHGLSVGHAAMVAGLSGGLAGITGLALGGLILDRLRRRGVGNEPCLIIGICLALSIPATFLFALAGPLGLSIAGFALATLLLQGTPTSAYAGIQMLASDQNRGTITGIFVALVTLGSFGLGPVCIGFLNDRVFPEPEGLGKSMVALSLIFGLPGAIAAYFAQRPFAEAVNQRAPGGVAHLRAT